MQRVFLLFFTFVCFIFLTGDFCFTPIAEKIFLQLYRDEILIPHRDTTRGFFHIMTEDLLKIEASRWPDQIAQWQSHFKFGIAIRPIHPSYFSSREMDELAKGIIVMRGDVNIAGNIFYQRIGNSDFALQLGKMELAEEKPYEIIMNIIAYGAVIAYFSILTLAWAYPFCRRLKRLHKAALAFGQGDFETRVKMPRYSALFPIADAFNRMAVDIQKLINAHRQLIRAVSYQLGQPVARMQLQLERLENRNQDSEPCLCINGMEKNIDELDALVSKLLIYARLDGHPPQISPQSCPLINWLTEIADYMGTELEGKQFGLHYQSNQNYENIRFDPKYMGQAVSNLLDNAAAYAHSRVELTLERKDDFILLYVDDDGPGISTEDRDRIFEPFICFNDGRVTDSYRCSLGLSIVKSVMQWHSGSVTMTSSPLGGSRFTLRWPGLKNRSRRN